MEADSYSWSCWLLSQGFPDTLQVDSKLHLWSQCIPQAPCPLPQVPGHPIGTPPSCLAQHNCKSKQWLSLTLIQHVQIMRILQIKTQQESTDFTICVHSICFCHMAIACVSLVNKHNLANQGHDLANTSHRVSPSIKWECSTTALLFVCQLIYKHLKDENMTVVIFINLYMLCSRKIY